MHSTNYYVGSTKNFARRITEHQQGNVLSTKGNRPLKVLYTKEYPDYSHARKVELRLKKQKSRKIIESYIRGEIDETKFL